MKTTVAAGVDIVALDAWGAEMMGKKPADIGSIVKGAGGRAGQDRLPLAGAAGDRGFMSGRRPDLAGRAQPHGRPDRLPGVVRLAVRRAAAARRHGPEPGC